MVEEFTLESFKRFCENNRFMVVKCNNCGRIFLPPKMFCPYCDSKDLVWMEIGRVGVIVSYTEVHVPLKGFEKFNSYIVVLVEFEGGIRLPGILKNAKISDLDIGVKVLLEFSKDYPSGYYFTLQQPL
ncbi:MAG: Zn-ribbon domain-containing OB-fold protein [Candidatus Methanomethylicia archaeon]